ncbi:hypothetical protein KKC_03629 [Listeria fleischmannii subsp. coloradonensis]|nr:hypothetical protein KKC_03629 [Listeria fleischmannii subsp. coloradonensis]
MANLRMIGIKMMPIKKVNNTHMNKPVQLQSLV